MRKNRICVVLSLGLLVSTLLGGCWSDTPQAISKMRMKELGLLLSMSVDSSNDTLPDMTSPATVKAALQTAMAAKSKQGGAGDWNDSIFIDPISKQPYVPNRKLSKLTMVQVGNIGPASSVIAFYSPEQGEGGRAVGYVDTHVEWVNESDWADCKKTGHAE